ncbi:MAG: carboxymuconolactone decarboxylase family protein [Candidatus Binatia bacterium]
MEKAPKPPKTYEAFVQRYPQLGQAWELMREAERSGPFDEKTSRLLKLAVAVGSQKEGPVHSSVRKALAAGISRDEIEQVVAIAASTIGLPPTVSIFSWVLDELDGRERKG